MPSARPCSTCPTGVVRAARGRAACAACKATTRERRRLANVDYLRVYRERHKAAGACLCGEPATAGAGSCAGCREYWRALYRARKAGCEVGR